AFARERRLALDQLGLALRNLRPNAWMMPALAAVICVIFHRWVATRDLAVWFTMVALASVPLGIVSHRYGHFHLEAENPRRIISLSTLAYLGFTLAWSSLGLFLWVSDSDFARLIVIMLLACTVAGNGALVGASRELTITSYVSYGGALILTPLRAGDF